MGYYCYNADTYCSDCLPVDEDHRDVSYDCSGETDSPTHCCVCHCPLEHSLTSHGVEYVIESIQQKITELERMSPEEREKPVYFDKNPNYYYQNQPTYAVVKDWAKDLKWYSLTDKDKLVVDQFLEMVGQV